MPISLSPTNPDAVAVLEALAGVDKGERSAALLRWAASYLRGQVNSQPTPASALGMSDDEIDALLDEF